MTLKKPLQQWRWRKRKRKDGQNLKPRRLLFHHQLRLSLSKLYRLTSFSLIAYLILLINQLITSSIRTFQSNNIQKRRLRSRAKSPIALFIYLFIYLFYFSSQEMWAEYLIDMRKEFPWSYNVNFLVFRTWSRDARSIESSTNCLVRDN